MLKFDKFKIGKFIFFEEFEELNNILSSYSWNKFNILDLWCWNSRMKILIDYLLKEKINYYLWIDEVLFNPQYADEFIQSDIKNFLLSNKRGFDLIILSWIFTNFLDFNSENLDKILKLLNKWGAIYINFWNYWDNWKFNDLYRSNNTILINDYIIEKIIPVLAGFKDIVYKIKLYKKNKNTWYNIVIIVN